MMILMSRPSLGDPFEVVQWGLGKIVAASWILALQGVLLESLGWGFRLVYNMEEKTVWLRREEARHSDV